MRKFQQPHIARKTSSALAPLFALLVFIAGCSSGNDQPNYVVEIPENVVLSDQTVGLLRNGTEIRLTGHVVEINDDSRNISITGDAFDTSFSGDEFILISDPQTGLIWTQSGNTGNFTWPLDNTKLSAALHFATLGFHNSESGIETEYSSIDLTVEDITYGSAETNGRFGFKLSIEKLISLMVNF